MAPKRITKTTKAMENALAGISQVQSKMDNNVLDKTRTWTSIVGMAPNSFYGTATEDVNVFVDEARRAATHNKWGNGSEAVCRLAYFLQGNAQYAFDAEVLDRVARKDAAKKERQQRVSATSAGGAEKESADVEGEGSAADVVGSMLAPKRTMLTAWERVYAKTKANLKKERAEQQELNRKLSATLREFVDVEDRRTDWKKSPKEMKEGESDEFSLGELTAAELEVRRDTLSAYLVTLQEQCEEKRGTIEKLEDDAEVHQQRIDEARTQYEVARTATEHVLQAQAEEEGLDKESDNVTRAFPTLEGFFQWLKTMFERKEVIHSYMAEFYRRKLRKGEKVQTTP